MKKKRRADGPFEPNVVAERLKYIVPAMNMGAPPVDPLGSYTGLAEDGSDPVQDADDL